MSRPPDGEAGEREPAGLQNLSPRCHDGTVYFFRAIALSADTYQITMW